MDSGQLEKAAKTFRGVIGLDPGDWQAYESLGKLYGKMGNNQFAERFRKRSRELKGSGKKKS
jgi:Flp pilus assembly protein TadD